MITMIGPDPRLHIGSTRCLSSAAQRYATPHVGGPHQLRSVFMFDYENANPTTPKRKPWNKGKLTGAKPPLRPKHVWSIRTKLQVEGRTRDLAMFNLAIDSKLRGCDVVALKVEDIAPHGYAIDRATVRQRKTGRPVRFEVTEQTQRRSVRPPRTLLVPPLRQAQAQARVNLSGSASGRYRAR